MKIQFDPLELTIKDAVFILQAVLDKFSMETYNGDKLEVREVWHISNTFEKITLFVEEKVDGSSS